VIVHNKYNSIQTTEKNKMQAVLFVEESACTSCKLVDRTLSESLNKAAARSGCLHWRLEETNKAPDSVWSSDVNIRLLPALVIEHLQIAAGNIVTPIQIDQVMKCLRQKQIEFKFSAEITVKAKTISCSMCSEAGQDYEAEIEPVKPQDAQRLLARMAEHVCDVCEQIGRKPVSLRAEIVPVAGVEDASKYSQYSRICTNPPVLFDNSPTPAFTSGIMNLYLIIIDDFSCADSAVTEELQRTISDSIREVSDISGIYLKFIV
jgi:hypothetical protein